MIKLQGPSQIITKDETVKVFTVAKQTLVDGKYVEKAVDSYDLTCNVQPVNGRDLLLVPEGDRFKEQYYVFTNELTRPLAVNYTIQREGVNFQVQSVEQWGSFQRARIMRIDIGPNKTP